MLVWLQTRLSRLGIGLAIGAMVAVWVIITWNNDPPARLPCSILYSDHSHNLFICDLQTNRSRLVCKLPGRVMQIVGIDKNDCASLITSQDGTHGGKLCLETVDLHNGRSIRREKLPDEQSYSWKVLTPNGIRKVSLQSNEVIISPLGSDTKKGTLRVAIPATLDAYRVKQAACSRSGGLAILANTHSLLSGEVLFVQGHKLTDSGLSAYSMEWLPGNNGDILGIISARTGCYEEYLVSGSEMKMISHHKLRVPFIQWTRHNGMLQYHHPTSHAKVSSDPDTIVFTAARTLVPLQPILVGRAEKNGGMRMYYTHIQSGPGLWAIYREHGDAKR